VTRVMSCFRSDLTRQVQIIGLHTLLSIILGTLDVLLEVNNRVLLTWAMFIGQASVRLCACGVESKNISHLVAMKPHGPIDDFTIFL